MTAVGVGWDRLQWKVSENIPAIRPPIGQTTVNILLHACLLSVTFIVGAVVGTTVVGVGWICLEWKVSEKY